MALGSGARSFAAPNLPSLEAALAANRDVWGEAAMAQPNGASYEFLAPLLPPPRYVHADFRHYPIILCPPGEIPSQPVPFLRGSDPGARPKARLISDGSGINLRGGSRSWIDVGVPVRFRVGPDEFLFGSLRDRVTEPELAEGWLPIPEIRYTHRSPIQAEGMVPLATPKAPPPAEIYRLEAFAATSPKLADHCVVFVKFSLAQGTNGFVCVEVDAPQLKLEDGRLLDPNGRVVAIFDSSWKRERGRMVTRIRADSSATLAVPTVPLEPARAPAISPAVYAEERAACVATWKALLGRGLRIDVPEPLVNHAWRNAVVQNFQLINHGQLRYSTGNQYDQIYAAEGSDAVMALLSWGYAGEARRLMEPLFDFTRKGLELHQASFKIGNLVRYVRVTRDADALAQLRPRWEPEAERFVSGRTGPNGLYPKEQYCGDIHTPVQSLNVNSKAWRALHDLGALLVDFGDTAAGRRYTSEAAAFRPVVLRAIERVASATTTPPFVPIALDGGEPVHSPILHSRIGSYWNIIIGYSIGSGIFPPGSPQEEWIPRFQEQHGGLFLGMVRSGGAAFNFWTGPERVNPLYGTRYTLDTLRRDEPERALVSFYGTLAQGLTRNTFVGGEGCTLRPVDAEGRFFYCPPNSAASAHVLGMLRHLLVQDCDLDDDGRPETLRLLFGTSRRWLEDGKVITVERAPTAFGEVSVRVQSRLAAGEVLAEVDLPTRHPASRTLLRVRVPEGWRITGAAAGGRTLTPDAHGTVDLSSWRGRLAVRFAVAMAAAR
ncbi:MAG: hypothetical protein HZC55_19820 [Verrucomicrobia bacterium]|nr:hypothetical protein [Verrucomicrobiota bacterium]